MDGEVFYIGGESVYIETFPVYMGGPSAYIT